MHKSLAKCSQCGVSLGDPWAALHPRVSLVRGWAGAVGALGMAGGHCSPAPAVSWPGELPTRAPSTVEICPQDRLEIEELGTACGVLREKTGIEGVRLFSCFHTQHFGLLFHY